MAADPTTQRPLAPALVVWALVALAALLLMAWPSLQAPLRYERSAILDGELWRLLSGQLLHLSWQHMWVNVAAALLIALLGGNALRASAWVATYLVCALGTGLGLLGLSPQVDWYVGLSGLLHGVLVVVALRRWQLGEGIGAVLLSLVAVKLAWEQFVGPLSSAADVGGAVITDAHLYGALSGLIWAGAAALRRLLDKK